MFGVEQSNQAERFLKGCDQNLAGRITEKVKSLRIQPFPSDARRVINAKTKQFRVRVGDYRVRYEVDYETSTIRIVAIEHRSRVYDF